MAGEEFLDLERRFWNALKQQDVSGCTELTADECIVAGSQGVAMMSRRDLGAMIAAAPYTIENFDIDRESAKVKMLSDEVALVAYPVMEELTVEGKPVMLQAFDTSVWVRRQGSWSCALHTESIAGDPFGRDRGPR